MSVSGWKIDIEQLPSGKWQCRCTHCPFVGEERDTRDESSTEASTHAVQHGAWVDSHGDTE